MSQSDVEKYLSEVRKRAESATSGPWDLIVKGLPLTLTNIDFMDNARTDVPRLLRMVEWLKKELILHRADMDYVFLELNKIARGE